MPMSLLETSIYVHPRLPVEFVIRMDDVPIRVAIEWEVFEQLMGPASDEAELVRDFLHRHRAEFASAIRAHLAAYGIPLTRQLTMSSEDLQLTWMAGRRTADDGRASYNDVSTEARTGKGASGPTAGIASTQQSAAATRAGEEIVRGKPPSTS
jgi:hypothetical protein